KVRLFQSSLVYADDRLRGYDLAVLMEVIEHVDPIRLPALERTVFGDAAPGAVIVTTPNAEYNPRYPGLAPGSLRHPDHRVEWTPAAVRRQGHRRRRAVRLPRPVRAGRSGRPRGRATHATRRVRAHRGRARRGGRPVGGAGGMSDLAIPELALVVLVGASGS